jgi:hypothetical protein
MTAKLTSTTLLLCSLFLVYSAPGQARNAPAPLKFEALLIWGTNESPSPDAKQKPVQPELLKKLKDLPLKWNHYYEVKRVPFEVAAGGTGKVTLSKHCELEVKDLGKSSLEITHIGKGEKVWKGTQALPKGETLVLGGNAPNATSWLVTLKRVE